MRIKKMGLDEFFNVLGDGSSNVIGLNGGFDGFDDLVSDLFKK